MRRHVLAAILLTSPAWLVVPATPVAAQEVPVREVVLENGMTFLFVQRPGDPNVAAGWIAKVGSAYERPGITGVAHLFEHMMFKGTRTLGTRDIDEDLEIIERLDELRAEIREEQEVLDRRARLGEIDDPDDPAVRSERHQELLDEFDRLLQRQKELLVNNEFANLYDSAGASSLNAATTEDFTIYFVNVPSNKLELWFWMESDRLLNPVFREFYSERDVVHEERRMRTDSTPIGRFAEQFDAMFWQSSPYSWPVVGWPSDLEGITREEALSFFDVYYAPNNLTAALVGDFDVEEAERLARAYFGRLPRGPEEPEEPRTREMPQRAEKRMIAEAETNPQVVVRYHTVPDGHVDEPALVVLGQILSGRTGRLYKSLVEERQVATSAGAGQHGNKFEGYFQFNGVAKQGRTPEEVEAAIYGELARLQEEPVGDRELQKIKNQFAAAEFRRLRSNFQLMLQLLVRDAYRSWETLETDPPLYQGVTAEDVRRVANTYFDPDNRAVATYYRKEGSAPPDPLFDGLDEQEVQQARQLRSQLQQARDPGQLQGLMQQLEQAGVSAPEENRDLVEVLKTLVQRRIDELQGEGEAPPEEGGSSSEEEGPRPEEVGASSEEGDVPNPAAPASGGAR